MTLSHLISGLEIAAIISGCSFCLIKGGPADRKGAALILAFYMLADLSFYISRPHFPTALIFACDFALAFGLLVVAVRHGSLWLGCAMVVQSVILCSEGLSFSGDGLSPQTQSTLNDSLSMVMLFFVVASACLFWHRAKARSLSTAAADPFSPSLIA